MTDIFISICKISYDILISHNSLVYVQAQYLVVVHRDNPAVNHLSYLIILFINQ